MCLAAVAANSASADSRPSDEREATEATIKDTVLLANSTRRQLATTQAFYSFLWIFPHTTQDIIMSVTEEQLKEVGGTCCGLYLSIGYQFLILYLLSDGLYFDSI